MKTITLATLALTTLALPLVGCDVEEPLEADELAAEEDQGAYHIAASELDDEVPQRAADADDSASLGPDQLSAGAGPAQAAPNFFEPVGTLDRADCSMIAGWAKDGDTTAPTWVSVRTAPWPGGSEVLTVYADQYRPGLPFPDKNHGFSFNTPASLKNGNTYYIYAHGINIDTNGDWDVTANSPLLNLSGRELCCGIGCFDLPDIPEL